MKSQMTNQPIKRLWKEMEKMLMIHIKLNVYHEYSFIEIQLLNTHQNTLESKCKGKSLGNWGSQARCLVEGRT